MIDSGTMHVVICSHLLGDVEETCEEVLILKQGRIVHHSNLAEERLPTSFVEIETSGEQNGFGDMLAGLGCPCVVDVRAASNWNYRRISTCGGSIDSRPIGTCSFGA